MLLLAVISLSTAAFPDRNDRPAERQVVFVHYDYMSGYDTTLGKRVSSAPPESAIEAVVESFRKHGVILHIDHHHNVIPYHEVVIPDWDSAWQHASASCTGNDAVSFMALKKKCFNPRDSHPWHYALFVHNAGLSGRPGCAAPFLTRLLAADPKRPDSTLWSHLALM